MAYYRALKIITERNNTSIPRTDDMFEDIGVQKSFSELICKLCFIKSEYILLKF